MADRYHKLYLDALAAYPDQQKKSGQQEINLIWNDIKGGRKDFNTELDQLKNRAN
jgi:hypothetical protein